MVNEFEFKQDPRDRSAWGIHERELVTRLVVDAIEISRRIFSTEQVFEDPVSAKQSNYITLDDYQKSALITSNTARRLRDQIMNAVLGLGGEAGEVIDILEQASIGIGKKSAVVLDDTKKYFFHSWDAKYHENPGAFEIIREKVAKELGDLLWYVAVLSHLFNYTLGDIAKINREKLIERHGASHTKTEDYSSDDVAEVEIHQHFSDGSKEKVFSWSDIVPRR